MVSVAGAAQDDQDCTQNVTAGFGNEEEGEHEMDHEAEDDCERDVEVIERASEGRV